MAAPAPSNRRVVSLVWLVAVGTMAALWTHFAIAWWAGFSLLDLLVRSGAELPDPLARGWGAYLLTGDRYAGLGAPTIIDGLVLLAVLATLWLIAREAGSLAATGIRGTAVCAVAAGTLTAGALATMLEIMGVWTRLGVTADPAREHGAPPWAWWTILAVSVGAWLAGAALARASRATRPRAVIVVAAAGLLLAVGSLAVQRTRPDPVQGRYHGIQGATVGREHPDEYGSYYGAGAGATVIVVTMLLLSTLATRADAGG